MPEIIVPRQVYYINGRFYVGVSDGLMTEIEAPGGWVPSRRVHRDISTVGLQWRQNSALVNGAVVSNYPIPYNTLQFSRATLKKVVQWDYEPDGLSYLDALFVFGDQIGDHLPETPDSGGEWEFRLPGSLRAVEGIGDETEEEDDRYRGYGRGLAYAHSAGHNYTIYGAAEIRTFLPDLSIGWVACRFDRSDEDQPGVCNKRHPLLHQEIWHDGSYIGFTILYPTE